MKRYWREFLKIPYFFNVNKFFCGTKKNVTLYKRTYHNTGKNRFRPVQSTFVAWLTILSLWSVFFTSGGNLILLALILKSVKWLQIGFFLERRIFTRNWVPSKDIPNWTFLGKPCWERKNRRNQWRDLTKLCQISPPDFLGSFCRSMKPFYAWAFHFTMCQTKIWSSNYFVAYTGNHTPTHFTVFY